MKKQQNIDINHYFTLAYDYVCNTSCNIFLTGKAGTGKTTFLKYIKQHCKKDMIVVAPTGVAAINAGGVTMHSFFQLPFNPYISDIQRGFGLNEHIIDKHVLFKNLKISENKRKIIRELELLIIDEASMLRSDMLDAINDILKAFRKNNKPFGGVQVLFIGDLYQLPPVVKDSEAELFHRYYQSPFFFHAKVFENTQPVFIELKTIYRQNEKQFIDLLNNIRHNDMSEYDFELLQTKYNPTFEPKDEKYITLTSHNAKADAINTTQLAKLSGEIYNFDAIVEKEFTDRQYPTEYTLKLKEGAQVMFIRNDTSIEKKYYNGKIAIVHKIEKATSLNESDTITVKFPDTNETMILNKEIWENISYKYNDDSKNIDEKILGTFTQYPLRLAWAITIHKSQGLTFTHAIIDAGSSFAPGQVYVALSRCTSLDGIVLHSRILPQSIQSDARIYDFHASQQPLHSLEHQLKSEKIHYEMEKIIALFDFKKILEITYILYEATRNNKTLPSDIQAEEQCHHIIQSIKLLQNIADKFSNEIQSIYNEIQFQNDKTFLIARLQKAITYFVTQLHQQTILPTQSFYEKLQGISRIKKYMQEVYFVLQIFWQKLERLQNCLIDDKPVLPTPIIDTAKTENQKPKTTKKAKGDSAKETLAYHLAGKTVEEISQIRRLAHNTILAHLIEFVHTGEVDATSFISLEFIEKIKNIYEGLTFHSSTEIVEAFDNTITYTQVRMALNHLLYTQQIEMKPMPAKETLLVKK